MESLAINPSFVSDLRSQDSYTQALTTGIYLEGDVIENGMAYTFVSFQCATFFTPMKL